MYIKSLELHGFKSFAQKSVLTFLPPKNNVHAITAIVGPNGSGKSNIVDAIRWVMGETSMKTLRGKKSFDVIFAGSDGKGKMGFATIVLTLDNTDRRMPLDTDEVVIARRMERDGDSEYSVNGAPARLFDVHVLLAQAQFGNETYSIIGQGMIDRLLLHTPQERKEFFDEACGIKEFQIKRHQATLKLDRTAEHVNEAEMLLNEISPRLKTLSRQVKKLEERQSVEAKLREAQESYFATMWGEQDKALSHLRSEHTELESKSGKCEQNLSAMQNELALLAKVSLREEQFQTLRRLQQEIQREKSAVEHEQSILSAKLQMQYSSSGQKELGWLSQKIDSLSTDDSAVQKQLTVAREEEKSAMSAAAAAKTEFESILERQSELRKMAARLEEEVNRLKQEEFSLPSVESNALHSILTGGDKFGSVFGLVADLGRAADEYALALGVAAGAHLSSLVVETDTVAERWINFLRKEQLGIAAFLPLNTIKPRIPPGDVNSILNAAGVRGLAKDLISYDKKFESIFSFIFGSTLVVETINDARRIGIGRIRMVTLDGDLVETNGSMKGGYRNRRSGLSFASKNAKAKLLQEMNEKETRRDALQKEMLDLESRRDVLERESQRAHERANLAKSRAESLAVQKNEKDRELSMLRDEYSLASADPKRHDELMAELRQKYEKLTERVGAFEIELNGIQTRMNSFHDEEEKNKQRVFALQADMTRVQMELNSVNNAKNDKQVEIARLETKQENVAMEALQETREEISSIIARGAAVLAVNNLPTVLQEIQKLKYALTLIGGIDEEVAKEYAETLERHEGLSTQLEDLNKAMKDLKTLIEELDDLMKKKRDNVFREIKKEFTRYFSVLFGGGKAEIVEVKGEVTDDGLGGQVDNGLAGIDIIANPPGKKVSNVQALSGGERTMTSIALLCAILRVNPSPFVVLDEIEASLDEANTVRFGHILKELSELSQFIIITHNRATMHIADTLYGVTMGGSGTSHLVSVKLD